MSALFLWIFEIAAHSPMQTSVGRSRAIATIAYDLHCSAKRQFMNILCKTVEQSLAGLLS